MEAVTSRRSARRDAVFLLYQRDVTAITIDELRENLERERGAPIDEFTAEVVEGVGADLQRIDAAIDAASTGWSVERIAPLERNIMRVAVHEIAGRADIPDAVAIDEAVGLAKRYCQAEAGAFVNGILGTIARSGLPT